MSSRQIRLQPDVVVVEIGMVLEKGRGRVGKGGPLSTWSQLASAAPPVVQQQQQPVAQLQH